MSSEKRQQAIRGVRLQNWMRRCLYLMGKSHRQALSEASFCLSRASGHVTSSLCLLVAIALHLVITSLINCLKKGSSPEQGDWQKE